MQYTISALAGDNPHVQTILDALGSSGIDRRRVEVMPAAELPEHGTDPVSTWSTGGGLAGLIIGAAIGLLAMSWSDLPLIGGLWGGVAGAIIGARAFGYVAADSTGGGEALEAGASSEVLISVKTETIDEVEVIKEALNRGGGHDISCAEESSGHDAVV